MTHLPKLTILCKSVLYTFQSGLCSLDADYNGMQALSSVTAPGELDGQVEEKEEEKEEKEKEEKEEEEEEKNLQIAFRCIEAVPILSLDY